MVVHHLVKLKTHGADVVELVRILDMVTNLVVEDTCRLDYPE